MNSEELVNRVVKTIRSGDAELLELLYRSLSSAVRRRALQEFLRRLDAEDNSLPGALSPREQTIMDMYGQGGNKSLTVEQIGEQAGNLNMPSLRQNSHVSTATNRLVTKGYLGKWNERTSVSGRPKIHFGAPKDAVMHALKRMKITPNKVEESHVIDIARMSGLSLSVAESIVDDLRIG